MSAEDQRPLAEIVSQFLDQWCELGTGHRVADLPLCRKFRMFWTRLTQQAASAELLEQFREELLQRGYHMLTGSHAYWDGLNLRGQWKKPPNSPELTARQRAVLLLLAERDLWSISELARALKCSLPTASRTVDRLERQGLAWCLAGTDGQRRVLVRLTARGQELVTSWQPSSETGQS